MATSVINGTRGAYHRAADGLKSFVTVCVRVVGYILRDIIWLVESFGLVLLWTVPMALLILFAIYVGLRLIGLDLLVMWMLFGRGY